MSAVTSPLIDIQRAEVWRGGTRVFQDLSLRIRRNENVAILGPNGAGKSTLIKLLCRDIYPVRQGNATVRILGRERFSVQDYRHVLGVVSHDFQADYPAATRGRDVVLSGFSATVGVHGVARVFSRQEIAAAERMMQQMGIERLAGQPFAAMSTGEQRRFLMARALVPQPAYLILDEPTAGLDLNAAFALLGAMYQHIRQGRTMVLATHHLHEIPALVRRVILLKAGRIEADGSADELLTSENLSQFYETPLRVMQVDGTRFALPEGGTAASAGQRPPGGAGGETQ